MSITQTVEAHPRVLAPDRKRNTPVAYLVCRQQGSEGMGSLPYAPARSEVVGSEAQSSTHCHHLGTLYGLS